MPDTMLNGRTSHIRDAATDLLNESRKFGNELYAEGAAKIHMAEEQLKEYSEDLTKIVEQNPWRSLLVAGGIGFILSLLLKK